MIENDFEEDLKSFLVEKIKKSTVQKLKKKFKILKNRIFDFGPPKISKSKNKKINKVCFSSNSNVLYTMITKKI